MTATSGSVISVSFPMIDIESDDAFGNSCSRDFINLHDGKDKVKYGMVWYGMVWYIWLGKVRLGKVRLD